ncbi:MAG: shikimate kinase [Bacteroidales bacterium]|nr:shikimate kinase [Bacteroidales bacterium]
MIIALAGFMGCGKSSVGRELSRQNGWEFVDLDRVIEKYAGKRIADIFAQDGEFCFRKQESQCLYRILEYQGESPLVLSLGGGAPLLNSHTLHEKCICIYLEATYEDILAHLGSLEDSKRPLLSEKSIRQKLAERAPIYQEMAHYIIKVGGKSVAQIAQEITERLKD